MLSSFLLILVGLVLSSQASLNFYNLPINDQTGTLAADQFTPYTRGGVVTVGPSMTVDSIYIGILDFESADIDTAVHVNLAGNVDLEGDVVTFGGSQHKGSISFRADVNDLNIEALVEGVSFQGANISMKTDHEINLGANFGRGYFQAATDINLFGGHIVLDGAFSDAGVTVSSKDVTFTAAGPFNNTAEDGRIYLQGAVTTLDSTGTLTFTSNSGIFEILADNIVDIDAQTLQLSTATFSAEANSGDVLYEGLSRNYWSSGTTTTLQSSGYLLANAPQGNVTVTSLIGAVNVNAGSQALLVANAGGNTITATTNKISISASRGINMLADGGNRFTSLSQGVQLTAGARFVSQAFNTAVLATNEVDITAGSDLGIKSTGSVNTFAATTNIRTQCDFTAVSQDSGLIQANKIDIGWSPNQAGNPTNLVEFSALDAITVVGTNINGRGNSISIDSGSDVLFTAQNTLSLKSTSNSIVINGAETVVLVGASVDAFSRQSMNLLSQDGISFKSVVNDVNWVATQQMAFTIGNYEDLRATNWYVSATTDLTSTAKSLSWVASSGLTISSTGLTVFQATNITQQADNNRFIAGKKINVLGTQGVQLLALEDDPVKSAITLNSILGNVNILASKNLNINANSIDATASNTFLLSTGTNLRAEYQTTSKFTGGAVTFSGGSNVEYRAGYGVTMRSANTTTIAGNNVKFTATDAQGNIANFEGKTNVFLDATKDQIWNTDRADVIQTSPNSTLTIDSSQGFFKIDAAVRARFSATQDINVASSAKFTMTSFNIKGVADQAVNVKANTGSMQLTSSADKDIIFNSDANVFFTSSKNFDAYGEYVRLGAVEQATFKGQGVEIISYQKPNPNSDVIINAVHSVKGKATAKVDVRGLNTLTDGSLDVIYHGGAVNIQSTGATTQTYFESNGGGARFYSKSNMTLGGKGTGRVNGLIRGQINQVAKDGKYMNQATDIIWRGGDIEISTNRTRETNFDSLGGFTIGTGNNEGIYVNASREVNGVIAHGSRFDSYGFNPVTGHGFTIQTTEKTGGNLCHTGKANALATDGSLSFYGQFGIRINSTGGESHPGPNITFIGTHGIDISASLGTVGISSDGYAFDRNLTVPYGVLLRSYAPAGASEQGNVDFVADLADMIVFGEDSVLNAATHGIVSIRADKLDIRALDTEAIVNVQSAKGRADLDSSRSSIYLTAGTQAQDGSLFLNATSEAIVQARTSLTIAQIATSSSDNEQGLEIVAQYGSIYLSSAAAITATSTGALKATAQNGEMSFFAKNAASYTADRGRVNVNTEDTIWLNANGNFDSQSHNNIQGTFLFATDGKNDISVSAFLDDIRTRGNLELNIFAENVQGTATNNIKIQSADLDTFLAGGSVYLSALGPSPTLTVAAKGSIDEIAADQVTFNAPTSIIFTGEPLAKTSINIDAGGDEGQNGINLNTFQGNALFKSNLNVKTDSNGLSVLANTYIRLAALTGLLRVDVRGDVEQGEDLLVHTSAPGSDIILKSFKGDINYDVGSFQSLSTNTVQITTINNGPITIQSERKVLFKGAPDRLNADISLGAQANVEWHGQDVTVRTNKDITFTSLTNGAFFSAEGELHVQADTFVQFLTNSANAGINVKTVGTGSDILFKLESDTGLIQLQALQSDITFSSRVAVDILGYQGVLLNSLQGTLQVRSSQDQTYHARNSLTATGKFNANLFAGHDLNIASQGKTTIKSTDGNEKLYSYNGYLNINADKNLVFNNPGDIFVNAPSNKGSTYWYAGTQIDLKSANGIYQTAGNGIDIVAKDTSYGNNWGIKLNAGAGGIQFNAVTSASQGIEIVADSGDISGISSSTVTFDANANFNVLAEGPGGVVVKAGNGVTGQLALQAVTISSTANRYHVFKSATNIGFGTSAAGGIVRLRSTAYGDIAVSSGTSLGITATDLVTLQATGDQEDQGTISFISYNSNLQVTSTSQLVTFAATTNLNVIGENSITLTQPQIATGTTNINLMARRRFKAESTGEFPVEIITSTGQISLTAQTGDVRFRAGGKNVAASASTIRFTSGNEIVASTNGDQTISVTTAAGNLNILGTDVGGGILVSSDAQTNTVSAPLITHNVDARIEIAAKPENGQVKVSGTQIVFNPVTGIGTGATYLNWNANDRIVIDSLDRVTAANNLNIRANRDVFFQNGLTQKTISNDITFQSSTLTQLTSGPFGDLVALTSGSVVYGIGSAGTTVSAYATLGSTGALVRGVAKFNAQTAELRGRYNDDGIELLGLGRDVVAFATGNIALTASQGSVEVRAGNNIYYNSGKIGFFGQTPTTKTSALSPGGDLCTGNCVAQCGGACNVQCPQVSLMIEEINQALKNYAIM